MVVDDEAEHRLLVRRILERDGLEVISSASGEEALERLKGTEFDLVLLDYMMPGLTGHDVLARIRESRKTRHLPVLMMTALRNSEEQVRALDQGANDFVSKPYEAKVLQARVRSLIKIKRLNDATEEFDDVLAMLCAAVEAKDPYTQGHSDRVSLLGARLAIGLGLEESTARIVQRAGLIHDIGKLVVDLSFINKPGKLTDEEWTIMKAHPEAGARIVAPLRVARLMLPLIRHHHERLNGRGYPDGLVEDQITLPVRILSVADVYDALTTKRSYRDSMPHEKAMGIMKREVEDGAWDALVVDRLESTSMGLAAPLQGQAACALQR